MWNTKIIIKQMNFSTFIADKVIFFIDGWETQLSWSILLG